MSRRKKMEIPEKVDGAYLAMPHYVLDCAAYLGATPNAVSMLICIARQLNGRNNGHLQATDTWLAKRGWTSHDTAQRARKELLERGLIVQTRQGGRGIGASLFAVTWLPISNWKDLDITSRNYHKGGYLILRDPTPASSRSRRGKSGASPTPPAGVSYPATRGGITPSHGADTAAITPPHGVETAVSGDVITPPHGEYVCKPLPSPETGIGSSSSALRWSLARGCLRPRRQLLEAPSNPDERARAAA